MVKMVRIDFGCNYVVVLQPRLRYLHLVVPIATFVLCCIKFYKYCKHYMLSAMRTLIGEAKVIRNCNTVLGLQLLQLIAMRTLEGKAKLILNCNGFWELQLLHSYCNMN
jgi:hypothetical protein